MNIAHRGASADAPENTLAAVRRAIELGVDSIELDVQRCKDGTLVIVHDTTLRRTTDAARVFPDRGPWRVADFTYDELLRLDAGSWRGFGSRGLHVPTLQEAFAMIRGSSVALLLELKAPWLYPGIVEDLAAYFVNAPRVTPGGPARPRVVVQSFNFAAMKELKTRVPNLTVGLLGTPRMENLPALGTWADQINPHYGLVNRSYVDAIHRQGMGCMVWTVDRPAAMRRALRLGVDGVITNRPDLFDVQCSRWAGPRWAPYGRH